MKAINCAAQIMWEADVGCVPVVDGGNRVVAMITDRDIEMAAYTQVYTCSPGDDVSSAEERIQKVQVRRLPVVDSKATLVGIISANEALTLARIGQHRHEALAGAQ
jgi:CBS domain-containing protein